MHINLSDDHLFVLYTHLISPYLLAFYTPHHLEQ